VGGNRADPKCSPLSKEVTCLCCWFIIYIADVMGGCNVRFALVLWYSDYGGGTDVSLDCGRFHGPIVRPRMRMNE
jgi:hypothetical protein